MLPTLFGFIDTYTLLEVVGILCAFVFLIVYLRKIKIDRNSLIDLLICGCIAIIGGLLFAVLFQNLYELIENPQEYKWTWGMTFMGGLFGGVIGFLLPYFFFYKKHHKGVMKELFIVAPGCITLAHAIGRIGCFCAGCCYGKHSDSGIFFPILNDTVIPTQLYEAIFLFVLSGLLLFLAFKFDFVFTFPIYMMSYGIWRFVIEFYRGDERGAFIGPFSPSQIWSMVLIPGAVVLFILIKKVMFKDEPTSKE